MLRESRGEGSGPARLRQAPASASASRSRSAAVERVEVGGGEPAGELLRHAGREGRSRGSGRLPALVREARVDDAPVLGARRPHDEPALGQPVDEARDAALAQPQRGADVGHAQPLLGRLAEEDEQVGLFGQDAELGVEQVGRASP